MAPIRRYLRITKFSVLECRIYLDNPALASSWLLHPRDPVLPRVIESVRPLVLPKLLEEKERGRKKGAKKKGAIKDVLVEDDYEVSIFLTETETRHSMLYKHRQARDKTQTRLVSNSSKLTGASRETPIDIEDDLRLDLGQDGNNSQDDGDADVVITATTSGVAQPRGPPNILREDSDEEGPGGLLDIPDIREAPPPAGAEDGAARRSKRRRNEVPQVANSDEEDNGDNDSLFSGAGDDDDDDDDRLALLDAPPAKRQRGAGGGSDTEDIDDAKKKKLVMDVSYEGFAIYGRVLCLVVKQRGPAANRGTLRGHIVSASSTSTPQAKAATAAAAANAPAGQAAMANWIASTQMLPGATDGDVP